MEILGCCVNSTVNTMSSRSRGCTNDPNIFCYICGEYVVKSQRQNITNFVKNVYYMPTLELSLGTKIKHGLRTSFVEVVLNH